MADLLSLYEQKIASSIKNNIYTDTSPYTNVIKRNSLRFSDSKDAPSQIPPEGNIYSGRNEYTDKNTFAPIATSAPVPGLGVFDVFAIAHWLKNIGQEFGILSRPDQTNGERSKNIAKGINFAASQLLLSTFNSGDPAYGGFLNQLYNPLSLALSAIPGLRVTTTLGSSPNAAAALSLDGRVYNVKDSLDRHLMMRQGVYQKAPDANDLAQLRRNLPGFRGDIAGTKQEILGSDKSSLISIQAQVDKEGPSGQFIQSQNIHTNLYTPEHPYSASPGIDLAYIEAQLKGNKNTTANEIVLKTLFKGASFPSLPFGIPGGAKPGPKYTWVSNRLIPNTYTLANPSSSPNNVDVAFAGEDDNGLLTSPINDEDSYMPFMFQDLRDKTAQFLYFRAFLKEGLTETFSPNWQSDNYYGRVDEVPIYQNTSRHFDISFDLVAWDVNDLRVMYRKLSKLQSMVYPSYDTTKFLQAGPLIRMRVGDLICASKDNGTKKGLPGYIDNLNLSYDDGIWNITEDFKVPRKISISLGFTVIHEGNPGVYANGDKNQFGALLPNEIISESDIRGVAAAPSIDPIFNGLNDILGSNF